MTYQYRVRDPLGNVHSGTVEAASPEDASQQLRGDGFQVLELNEDDGEAGTLLGGRVTKSDVIYTTSQVAVMIDTGVNLSEALGGIIEQEQNGKLRDVLIDLKQSVEAGEDFSVALARYPKLFDKTYVSLVRAGEATGALGTMLDRIAAYLRKEVETRSKVRSAMAYPTVMMFLAIGVTIFLLTYILPKFMPLFEAKGADLPGPTKFVMGISDVIVGHWYLWASGVLATIVSYLVARRTQPGRQLLDMIKINLPLLGPLSRKVAISRSIRTLATMLRSGVPTLDAINLCGEVAGNVHYEELWLKVRDQVTAGEQIHRVLAGSHLFPRVLVQMISAGEGTGKLDYVLERISNYYDHEVDSAIKTATSVIEPLMISAMGVIVGGIGLALLLPIFSLSKQP
jgi:type IV pilus assembly protein PilC